MSDPRIRVRKELQAGLEDIRISNMHQFPSAKSLSKWAGVCSGNKRPAGKRKHSHIRKADKYQMSTKVQAAWGATRTEASIFRRKYHRWLKKLGPAKAQVATCHALLVVAPTKS